MSTGFIGQVMLFGGTFAPRDWAFCDGTLLPIAQNTALFSIIGCTYGGDCRTSFALPDLRGRTPLHAGTGPGLSPKTLGQKGGEETVTLTTGQIPAHNHSLMAQTSSDQPTPVGNVAANLPYSTTTTGLQGFAPTAIENAGGGQAHENRQPYLVLNFVICLNGVYPSRN